MRKSVTRWPWKRPKKPSDATILRAARPSPKSEPRNSRNSGLDVWNKILIRSNGAMSVFAADPEMPPARPERNTYSAECLSIVLISSGGRKSSDMMLDG